MKKTLLLALLLALLLLLFGCAPPGYTFGEDGQLSPADGSSQQAANTEDSPSDSADAGAGQNDADTNSGSQAEDTGADQGEPMNFGDDEAETAEESGIAPAEEDFNWLEDLCSGEWHSDYMQDENIEIEGTIFEDITPIGTRIYEFYTDNTMSSKGFDDDGEQYQDHVHAYHIHEVDTMFVIILGETMDEYHAYEFDGEVYEVYIIYRYEDGGSLYETVYFMDEDNEYHRISNTCVYVKK